MSLEGSSTTDRVLPRASGKQSLKVLLAEGKGTNRTLALAILCLLVCSAAGLAMPLAVGITVDVVSGKRPVQDFTLAIIVLVVAAIIGGLLTHQGKRLIAKYCETVLAALRQKVTAHALRLPLGLLEKTRSGDLVSRVSGDVEKISAAAQGAVSEFVSAGLSIALTLIGLAVLDYRFALAGLLALPTQAFTLWRYLKKSNPLYTQERLAEGRRAQEILQSQSGSETINAFNVRPTFLNRVAQSSQVTVRLAIKLTQIRTIFYGRLNLAEFVGLASILTVGFWLYSSGQVSLGVVSAAALFFSQLFDPLNTVLGLFDVVQQAGSGLTRLAGVLSVPLAKEPAPHPGGLGVRGQAITVKNLRVEYHQGRPVLRDVSVHIPAGQRVAIVGTSGAGKSTLGAAISGERDAVGGYVMFNEARHTEYPMHQLRQVVAEVNQQAYVFSGSLADDLRLAAPQATEAQLQSVLVRVGAWEWVQGLPQGLRTVVGQSGYALTPSQNQHLALARLALLDPAVVILDEATAEDSPASRALERATSALTTGKTAVIIAHRLSQAASADRVLVMAEGRIIQGGTHEELLAVEGRYQQLWRAQHGGL